MQSFKDSDQKFVVLTQSSKDLSKTEVVSSTSNGHIKWDYGQMRGGTPARLFGTDTTNITDKINYTLKFDYGR